MDCQEVRKKLPEYIDGELEFEQARRIRSHSNGCYVLQRRACRPHGMPCLHAGRSFTIRMPVSVSSNCRKPFTRPNPQTPQGASGAHAPIA